VPFNELPDMKAAEITAAGKEALLSKRFDMVRINYANPDMVGAYNILFYHCPLHRHSFVSSVPSTHSSSRDE
jgi:Metalloenzyme superfamily